MDPDAALIRLRRAAEGIDSIAADPAQDWSGELIDVLEHVAALDEWISRGGFLPGDWRTAVRPGR
ncbi:hypothetical protein AB0Q95_45480 [Streptomyces sp. NPDC059900]|uniref:hypothetical protein n=1 Tax=Streptomyces sp. NPDC059900 TaxID=3155816 RepID=UPI003446DC23